MLVTKKNVFYLTFLILDLILVLLAWVFSYYIRFYTNLPIPKGLPKIDIYLKLMPFILLFWLISFFYIKKNHISLF